MEFPKEYAAPKVEDIASTTAVAWGDCTGPGSSATPTDCILNGTAATASCQWGDSAGGSCSVGSGFVP